MISVSGFEVMFCHTDIMHRTLILGVYGGFIHEAWVQMCSFEWTVGFSPTVTFIFGVLCFRFQDFCIVLFYYSTHVAHAAVTSSD